MTIHVRAKAAFPDPRIIPAGGLRAGEEAALDGAVAKEFQAAGQVWVIGGDPADFAAFGITADADCGPPIVYAPSAAAISVVKGE